MDDAKVSSPTAGFHDNCLVVVLRVEKGAITARGGRVTDCTPAVCGALLRLLRLAPLLEDLRLLRLLGEGKTLYPRYPPIRGVCTGLRCNDLIFYSVCCPLKDLTLGSFCTAALA